MTRADKVVLVLIVGAMVGIGVICAFPSYEDRTQYDQAKKGCAALGMAVGQDFAPGPHAEHRLQCIYPGPHGSRLDLW